MVFITVNDAAIVPIQRLFSRKCRLMDGDCPHENVNFWLYTR